MARKNKDADWTVTDSAGRALNWEAVLASVLMDVRDELKELNRHARQIAGDVAQFNNSIQCRNFQRVPAKLDRIGRAADKLAKSFQPGDKK